MIPLREDGSIGFFLTPYIGFPPFLGFFAFWKVAKKRKSVKRRKKLIYSREERNWTPWSGHGVCLGTGWSGYGFGLLDLAFRSVMIYIAMRLAAFFFYLYLSLPPYHNVSCIAL
jgi:hypothetical protein